MPCVRDIGLWSDRLRQAYADMGVLDCGRADLEALMRADEQIAENLDAQRFAAQEATRASEVAQVIAVGAADCSRHLGRDVFGADPPGLLALRDQL